MLFWNKDIKDNLIIYTCFDIMISTNFSSAESIDKVYKELKELDIPYLLKIDLIDDLIKLKANIFNDRDVVICNGISKCGYRYNQSKGIFIGIDLQRKFTPIMVQVKNGNVEHFNAFNVEKV